MGAGQGVTYTYDGDGKRVMKSSGKLYWYGVSSDPLAESDAAGNITDEYVFFGGKRLARRKSTGEINYYFADHLGSSRVVTSATGQILDDSDFYPFGGERSVVSSSGNTYKFTGKERDSESGLDYFGARYYASLLGRFTSPDAGPYDLKNPQSLNRYTYALNSPLKLIDPDGEMVEYVIDQKKKTISLKVKITVYGPGATQKYAAQLKKQIEKAWQGTAKVGGKTYAVKTEATVEIFDQKTQTGAMNPNWVYVTRPGEGGSQFEGRPDRGEYTAWGPRWTGRIDPIEQEEAHEGGHMTGLGDDYYRDTRQALAGHEGHLMAGARATRAAEDELNRIAGYIVSRGESQGTIIWLPGSKTSYENTAERQASEKKDKN